MENYGKLANTHTQTQTHTIQITYDLSYFFPFHSRMEWWEKMRFDEEKKISPNNTAFLPFPPSYECVDVVVDVVVDIVTFRSWNNVECGSITNMNNELGIQKQTLLFCQLKCLQNDFLYVL